MRCRWNFTETLWNDKSLGWLFFYLVDRALRQCFKLQLHQTGKSWFCVQVCEKSRRQHSEILLINDQSNPLVCHVYSMSFSSLTWENLKGLILVNILRTIWTFSNGTKVVGISLTPPKLYCHGIISHAIILVVCCAVYMPLFPGFCLIELSKGRAHTQW